MEYLQCSYLLKYTMDKVIGVFLLFAFSPLLIAIMLGIKLEGLFFAEAKGPILVSELRVSKGKIFRLYKFRKLKKKILDSLRDKEPGTYSFTDFQSNPDNLTYIGKLLKKFYLDEFPQIINVLKGDISFVGPRPHLLKAYEKELRRGVVCRKIMRCGLTGLVAINKGCQRDDDNLDAEYLKKSLTYTPLKLLLYDLWILEKTIELIFRAKGY